MKKALIILILATLLGCRTAKKAIEKQSSELTDQQSFESSLSDQGTLDRDYSHSLSSSLNNSLFKLFSTPVFDSEGNQLPFIFRHTLDGVMKEEIYLQGGEIVKENESKSEIREESIKEHIRYSYVTKTTYKTATKVVTTYVTQTKYVTVKGFQAGTYVTAAILILFLLLLWLGWKFKIPDKIRAFLNLV